jgi:ATP-dependent Lon protease
MAPKMNKKNDKNKRLRKNKPDSDSESSASESEETIYETASDTDSTYTPPKKTKKSKRIVEESSESEESEKVKESSESEESEEFDQKKFRKTLAKLFPSKYISKKVNKDKEKEKEKEEESKPDKKKKQKETKEVKSSKKDKKKAKVESESEEESDIEYESDDLEDEDDSNDESSKHRKGKNEVNIVFSIAGGSRGDDYEDDYDDYEDEYDEDTEDEECNSEDEETFMKETYEKIEMPKEPVETPAKSKKSKKSNSDKSEKAEKSEKSEKSKMESEEEADVQTEYVELQELRKQLTEKLHKKPNSKILKNAIAECKETIRELVKTTRSKNTKSYYKLVHKDRERTDEMDYFKKHLSNKEQMRIMKEMKEINNHIHIEKPYRLALLQANIPAKYKAVAMQKLNVLKMMDPGDNEYYKIKNWVDTFMKVPFNIQKSLSVSMSDGVEACHNFMGNAKQILDNCVYGLDDAKMQIMQMVGQWISNPSAMGTAIAIKGPPGTGKTSLVKEGISKILGREFAFIALGGTGDSSFLEGHSYTYEGSSWGKIVQILVDSKCMNPVIYFDELDKISDTPRGEEIVGILTHLTDTSQNNEFHDKYFSEISFDLSKCLFIFSYNDESRVNPILKDRMYCIQTKGYEAKDKVIIAKNYMLPKIREQVAFQEGDVIIPDDVIQYIASSQILTKGESGVRNLKRCLEIIHTKLNLFRLMKPGDNMFMKDIDIEVKFPFTVTRQLVDKFVKSDEPQNQSFLSMYM